MNVVGGTMLGSVKPASALRRGYYGTGSAALGLGTLHVQIRSFVFVYFALYPTKNARPVPTLKFKSRYTPNENFRALHGSTLPGSVSLFLSHHIAYKGVNKSLFTSPTQL